MSRKLLSHGIYTILIFTSLSAFANPGQPNFMPSVYGDGEVWGTKGTTTLQMKIIVNPSMFFMS